MKRDDKWHSGPPPHVGWWNASFAKRSLVWRWWDGDHWGAAYLSNDTDPTWAAEGVAIRKGIQWRWYWPEGARVPRINPQTGEVTGGDK